MFSDCNTLADLNARRIKLSTEGIDLIDINNAYNSRRQEILTSHKPFVKLTPIIVKAEEVVKVVAIPVVGRSQTKGCIEMVENGFLY